MSRGIRLSSREDEGLAPHGSARPAMLTRIAWGAASGLFLLAAPVGLILGAVRLAFSWQPVYTYAVTAYHADQSTGVPTPELLRATHIIRNYFTNDQRDLDITVLDTAGKPEPLFNDREIEHMRDVKALVQRVYLLLDFAVAYAILYSVAMLTLRPDGARTLARWLLRGSSLTGALIIAFGVAATAGFDQLFLEFHQLSFSNDFWELDPATDHLIQIFPQGFWFDVTMFVAVLALLAAALVAAASGSYLLLQRRRLPSPLPPPRGNAE